VACILMWWILKFLIDWLSYFLHVHVQYQWHYFTVYIVAPGYRMESSDCTSPAQYNNSWMVVSSKRVSCSPDLMQISTHNNMLIIRNWLYTNMESPPDTIINTTKTIFTQLTLNILNVYLYNYTHHNYNYYIITYLAECPIGCSNCSVLQNTTGSNTYVQCFVGACLDYYSYSFFTDTCAGR
jgi:hypothetical protein